MRSGDGGISNWMVFGCGNIITNGENITLYNCILSASVHIVVPWDLVDGEVVPSFLAPKYLESLLFHWLVWANRSSSIPR